MRTPIDAENLFLIGIPDEFERIWGTGRSTILGLCLNSSV